ncbi:DUF4235 domain-containing protein [Nocardioides litoris]|uniref:DUF4235 domain-containing protein n=1 Tax=Nocardioides litoris TaxID=1926648 RepID=UPI001FEA5E70|nr:DUF4235 domain-containing protein [Nocardioides litoris]
MSGRTPRAKIEDRSSKSAKILYKPWGIVGSLLSAIVARQIFQKVATKVIPVDSDDPPKPLESEYRLREIVITALVQGAIFAVVKALFQRGSARAFQRWTGEWPGD